MKYFIGIISLLNLYLGIQFLLNVIDVLQTSKYSPIAAAIFSTALILMGSTGFYFSLVRDNTKLALSVSVGPWVFILVGILLSLLFSTYK